MNWFGFIQIQKYYLALMNQPKYINLFQQNNFYGLNQIKLLFKVTIALFMSTNSVDQKVLKG